MLWRICSLLLAVGTFGCDAFDSCGPFSTNKTHFQDSLAVYAPLDSIKLEIGADYDYNTQIPVTIIRTTEFGDSLNFIGSFEGIKRSSKAEMRNDTLTLDFGYYSIIAAKGTPASGAKGNSFDLLCSPPAERTKLLSATLFIPSDLAVSIIWPRNIKVIE